MIPMVAFGATSAGFERPGGGARSAALGGHSVVLPDDDHALGSSPGRLVFASRSASAQYDRIDPDVELWRGRVGVVLPMGRDLTEPLQTSHVRRNAVGLALDVTSLTLIEGSAYREAAVSLGGAVAPMGILGLGGVVRYERASSDLDAIQASAWGVDVGLAIELSDHIAGAIAVRNALGRTSYDGGDDEDRAGEVTLGLGANHYRWWSAEVDYVYRDNTTSALAGGVELHAVPGTLDLRAGAASEEGPAGRRVIPSAGAGFAFDRWHLDYAFRSDKDGSLDAQHQVALTARF
jgi:hypothetical protein